MSRLLYGFLIYEFVTIIYRLYLHPLSKFPGPRLAAISSFYSFYFNVIRGGMFIWEIEKMHRQYGPIIRITPNEIHISDPDFFTTILAGRRDRDPSFFTRLTIPKAMGGTINHYVHASRRRPLSNFFSRPSIEKIEPMIASKVQKLCARLKQAQKAGSIVHLDSAFSALTADIISEYCYGFSVNYLDDESFRNDIQEASTSLISLSHIMHFMPFKPLVRLVPDWLVAKISPSARTFLGTKDLVRETSESVLRGAEMPEDEKNTVFDALNDPAQPPEERSLERMVDEGLELMIAGVDTTASTLKLIMFHLIYNKDLLLKLREELVRNSQSTVWSELQKLPYLSGVINEGLRLWTDIFMRLVRIAPEETLHYKHWVIPAGTLVSGNQYFLHMNPEFFPDPNKFDPERWVDAEEPVKLMNRFVPFGKGTRQCLGQKLALAELYLTLGALVRHFDFELFETTPEDILHYREYVTGHAKEKNHGLRVEVKPVL